MWKKFIKFNYKLRIYIDSGFPKLHWLLLIRKTSYVDIFSELSAALYWFKILRFTSAMDIYWCKLFRISTVNVHVWNTLYRNAVLRWYKTGYNLIRVEISSSMRYHVQKRCILSWNISFNIYTVSFKCCGTLYFTNVYNWGFISI